MPFTLTAQTVRFIHREWEMDGRSGVSHKLTVADGDELFTVKIPQDLLDVLDTATIDSLGVVGYTVQMDLAQPRAYPNATGAPRVDLRAISLVLVAPESAGR